MTMGHILKWLKSGKPKPREVFLKETQCAAGGTSWADTDPAAGLWRHTSVWIFSGNSRASGSSRMYDTVPTMATVYMLLQLEHAIQDLEASYVKDVTVTSNCLLH